MKSVIIVGKGVLSALPDHLPKDTSRVFVIADNALISLRKKTLKVLKTCGLPVAEIPVNAGERLKDISQVYAIYGKLIELGADRHSVIVALGGGTVGDAAGFVAATFMRGLPWIGVPTTLLAQVDSSVGGKTGINHKKGKNLIGAFHQPVAVLCDTESLKTLGEREMVSGVGEIIKYSLTYDPEFFCWLKGSLPRLLKKDSSHLVQSVGKSLEWKSKAVEQDEFDRTGVREVLNFGHTFGHALESVTAYKKFQHGEAVIWGMRFALALSFEKGLLAEEGYREMQELLLRVTVPPLPRNLDVKKVFESMKKDKKSQAGHVRFVLLDKLGHTVSCKDVTRDELERAFERMINHKGKKNVR